MDRPAARRDKLRRLLRRQGVDALLVTGEKNVTYLTGFTGDSSYLLLGKQLELLITDFRYVTQLADECPGLRLDVRKPGVTIAEATARVIRAARLKSVGIEDSLTLGVKAALDAGLPGAKLCVTSGLVEGLRQIKDRDELAAIRRAIRQAEKAFAVLRASLLPEKTEKQVADELEQQIRLQGGKCTSFPPIVAVGPNAALPHAQPGGQRIAESFVLLVDWGSDEGLYKSDLTRVLLTGKIPPKLRRTYGVVLKAQRAAIDAIRPGATCEAVDAVARRVIDEAGFGKYFGHGLGHGIGLDIHEEPRMAPGRNQPFRPGMVVTVEPGIYLPGRWGIRIEDDVLVTKNGREVLSGVEKEFDEMLVD